MPALALPLLSCRGSGEPVPLRAYGSIEARQVRVASRVPGRVLRVLVDENDAVVPGQPLVELDLHELDARRDQARAVLAQALARERLLRHGARQEDIVAAQKAIAAARLRAEQAGHDRDRADMLRASNAISPSAHEATRTAFELATTEVATRSAELQKIVKGARAEELEGAAAARDEAGAALAVIEEQLSDRILTAPLAGTVIHRLVEPGEVVRPAAPLLVIGDLARPYMDVYVPEPRLADARLGTGAEVEVDAFPGRVLRATVTHVSSEAEFTPKNVQTEEQRARLVFRVRVTVEDPQGLLRPGMPGAAVFTSPASQGPGDGGPGSRRKS